MKKEERNVFIFDYYLALLEFFAQFFTLKQQVGLSVTDDEKESKYVIMHVYSFKF
jgi:hypothetical protein